MSGNGSGFKVYTKTGDKGTSSLFNGERRPKDDQVFNALGTVDEVNSALGVAHEFCKEVNEKVTQQLEEIQSRLLDVGSAVATPLDNSPDRKLKRVEFDHTATSQLESWIDDMDTELAPLRSFILPSGGKAASFLHLSRTICRRAERLVVPLAQGGQTDEAVAIYLNRLSDYLFTAARYLALKEKQPEVIYKKQ